MKEIAVTQDHFQALVGKVDRTDKVDTADNTAFRMIDVSQKVATHRKAVAKGRIYIKSVIIERIRQRQMPKGDVLALAEVAGIMAAKNTPQILPLCHPLQLDAINVTCTAHHEFIEVTVEVRCFGKTGVEMEALCAVNAALLCIYDLTKIVEPEMTISDIHLVRKEGGKSGVWEPTLKHTTALVSSEASLQTSSETKDIKAELVKKSDSTTKLKGIKSAVVTVSDRCSQGLMVDFSGPLIDQWLQERGMLVLGKSVVPDEKIKIQTRVKDLLQEGARLIILTGGTGLGVRDITPEALLEIADKEVVGFGELLRAQGAEFTPLSYLSRSTAVLIETTLVVSLPGSQKAVQEGLTIIEKLLPHALHIASGGNHETRQHEAPFV